MKAVNRKILEQVIAGTMEPLLVVRTDQPDWPVALTNPAFAAIAQESVLKQPFADVIESIAGREMALEVSEAIRSREESSLPIEAGGREYLLVLRPLQLPNESTARFCAAYWRGGAASDLMSAEMQHALLKAKRRIRDLSRDDPVTGLLNERAFVEVFEHDWAVAKRENSKLSVVVFRLDEFDVYVDVFGRHASDSCLRRVGQAIRRSLRRASDVVAHTDRAGFAVLSHASDEQGVREFAGKISTAVRELGLHHPRASASKFVTVSYDVAVAEPTKNASTAQAFLLDLFGETEN